MLINFFFVFVGFVLVCCIGCDIYNVVMIFVLIFCCFICLFFDQLISQIVVGEVVEWLVFVVKELLENVLDVGVMQLQIKLEEGGVWCIVIIDNGGGILVGELFVVLMWYVISKIGLLEELELVLMLGFWGEVLVLIVLVVELMFMLCIVNDVYVM